MVRGGAAAAANNIQEAALGELVELGGHVRGRFVVFAHFVGEASVGIDANERVRDARQLVHVGQHLVGAECTVEADRDRFGVAHCIPERGRGLAR